MKALILFNRVHELFHNDSTAISVPFENWSPTPQALVDVPEDLQPHLELGTLWDAEAADFDLEDVRKRVIRKHVALFEDTFNLIDKYCLRPVQDLTARNLILEGNALADADRIALEEEIAADKQRLIGLRNLAAANRDLQAKLRKASTWQEVVAILPEEPIEKLTLPV